MEKEIITSVVSFFAGAFFMNFLIQKKLVQSKTEIAKLETQLENFNSLKEIFQKLANDSISQSQETLIKNNQLALQPFRDELKEFKQKVELLQNSNLENSAALKEKIDTLTKDSFQLRFQAEELTNTLKINAKGRGLFGELILEQLLDSAGLINKNADPSMGNYITQKGYKESGSTKSNFPDAVIFYPNENKHVIIDSKCALNDFLLFSNEQNEEQKKHYLKNFYNSVWIMAQELSEKYNNLEGLNSPDFKLMFIPVESAYLYILDNQDLTLKITKKNIIIVGPSSLLAVLKIIKEAWDTKNLSDNMLEIKTHAIKLYEKFCIFLDKFEKLGTHFQTVHNDFDGIFTTIKGQDGLINKFEKIKMLGVSPTKHIDKKFITSDSAID